MKVSFMHIGGKGRPEELAKGLKNSLNAQKEAGVRGH
jgi:hypothetical protein